MTDKEIGWTGRYAGCWDDQTRPKGFQPDVNEGTVYEMSSYLKERYNTELKD